MTAAIDFMRCGPDKILARCSTDKEEANRHSRIALALLRSLSANLGEEYRKSFLERNDALK